MKTKEKSIDIKLSDFVLERTLGDFPGTKSVNYTKILKLSDEDFSKYYTLVMEEYRDNDGYWKNGNPKCFECNQDILSPDKMRKYFGNTLHGHCFTEVYLSDRSPRDKATQMYFDRIAAMSIKTDKKTD